MSDAAISGSRDGKLAPELRAVWETILNTLRAISAEKQAPAATRAMVAPSPAAPDVLDHVTQAAEVSPSLPRRTERDQKVAQLPHSGGVVNDVESGGAEGGAGPAREVDHQGGAQGGDSSDTGRPSLSPAQGEVAPPVRGGPAAQGETASAAQEETTRKREPAAPLGTGTAATETQPRHINIAGKYPVPSEANSSVSKHESLASLTHDTLQLQRNAQRADEFQQVTIKLTELLHYQNQLDKKTSTNPQSWGRVQLQHDSHCIPLTPMFDTGSTVSFVNLSYWPSDWPLQASSNHIIRAGGMAIPFTSTNPISIVFENNQVIATRPYVMTLPEQLPGLLGKDVLSQIN